MWFVSDNAAPAAPEVLASLTRANEGYTPAYGKDPLTERVTVRLREIFEAPDAAVHLVGTGTAGNVLALACLCPPWATIYCHRNAHIEEDECGAPEFYTGGSKLTLLEGDHARITPDALTRAISFTARAGVHNVQRGALSLTNSTELGAVYTPADIRALSDIAHDAGLPVHLDGARFANALVGLGCSPADLTWRAGVDVLTLGGTKNGLMGVEAVIFFDPAKSWEFELRRKRGGHLFSKHRYLAAQMDAWLEGGLWLDLASRANARAAELSAGIAALPGAKINHPTEANAVFASWPRAGHRALQEAGAQYYLWPGNQSLEGPDDEPLSARLVCSWSTRQGDVAAFLAVLSEQVEAQAQRA
ncbi:threonine aldolase family protein [Amaricoccus macauensis]|uniref:threonine aldolase family protein n=1 Tax=Amaricoccus macauensis TaxID=57001 RepID=UPI003C7DAB32